MSLRQVVQPQDIDLQQKATELAFIEGEIKTRQSELDAIVSNKKRIESENKDIIETFEKSFQETKKTLTAEIDKLQVDCVAWRKEQIKAKEDAQIATDSKDKIVNENQNHKKDLETIISKKDLVHKEHLSLIDSKSSLEKEIQILTKEVSDLEKSKEAITSGISSMVSKRGDVEKELAQILSQISIEEDNLKNFQLENETISSESNKLSKNISELNKSIEILKNEIVDLQKKKDEHAQSILKREGEINERMGNLSILENRVDDKLQQLKEAKKEFTVEHLARIGIKD